MPRGKQRLAPNGAPAQQVKSVPGQRYGEGVEQQAMMRQMPAADMAKQNAAMVSQAGAAPAAAPAAGGVPGPVSQPPDLAALMGGMPTGLLAGTQLPNQPITAGLSTGPGPGPEALAGMGAKTPMRRMLDLLSAKSGDPYFRQLADRARL